MTKMSKSDFKKRPRLKNKTGHVMAKKDSKMSRPGF